MSNNTWLTVHAHPLEQMRKFLTECEYKPEYDNFPLRPLQKILNGAAAEISRLHNENAQLKSALKNATKPPETPQPEPKSDDASAI
jgi:hypothetical protein